MQYVFEKILVTLLAVREVFAIQHQQPGGSFPRQPLTPPALPDPFQGKEIADIIANVTHFLAVTVAPPLAAVLIIVGALQMMFAGGSPERFKTGQKTIMYTVIGFFIVLIATGVASLIKKIVTGN